MNFRWPHPMPAPWVPVGHCETHTNLTPAHIHLDSPDEWNPCHFVTKLHTNIAMIRQWKSFCFFLWVYNEFTSAVYFTIFSYNLIPKKCRGWGMTWKWPVLYTGLKNLRKTRNNKELGANWEGSMHIGWSLCIQTGRSPLCQSKTKEINKQNGIKKWMLGI